jgi:ubiquinone/menaquinone biosynthesis C-methylase UbiE
MTEFFDSKAKTWDQHQYRVERAQVVAKAIESKIPLSQVKTALDFGCGTGLLGLNLADKVGHIVLSDTSPGMIEQVNRKIQTVGNIVDPLGWTRS